MSKILHISRTMDIGGAEKIVFQLTTDLKYLFDKTYVSSTGGKFVEELNNSKIDHVSIHDIESKNIVKIISNFLILYKLVLKEKIDIIHVHHRMGLVYAKFLKFIFKNLRIIYTAHNIFVDKVYFYKKLISNVEVIAVGESVANSLIKDIGFSEKITIINNCIKLENKTDDILEESFENFTGYRILSVARLSEQKGIKYLIESIPLVKSSNFKVFILGDGEKRPEFKTLSKTLGISDKVEFLGFKKNVSEYIKKCDFMVMPSLWEGLPLTAIECFMNKKTIIATNIPGIIDIVNNNNGIIIETKMPCQIAESIDFLVENKQILVDKEKYAFETYVNNYSYDVFLNKYKQYYFKENE